MKILLIRLIYSLSIMLGGTGVYTFGYKRLTNIAVQGADILSESGHTGGAIASGMIACMGLYCFLKFEIYLMSKESQ
jgi:hypothetical protein